MQYEILSCKTVPCCLFWGKYILKKKGVALKTNQFLKHKIKTHVKKQQSSEFFQDEGIVPLDSCLFVHMRNVGVLG